MIKLSSKAKKIVEDKLVEAGYKAPFKFAQVDRIPPQQNLNQEIYSFINDTQEEINNSMIENQTFKNQKFKNGKFTNETFKNQYLNDIAKYQEAVKKNLDPNLNQYKILLNKLSQLREQILSIPIVGSLDNVESVEDL